jgi:ketosteroid isomerase-like protein
MAAAMSDLESRLERVEAVEGVRELLWRYASTVDRLGPIEELADAFTEDAVLINPDRIEGRQAILEYYGGVLGSVEFAHHHITNSTITVEQPGRARHRSYFVALIRRAGGEVLVFGEYDDVAVRCDDGLWRFSEKGNNVASATALPAKATTEG